MQLPRWISKLFPSRVAPLMKKPREFRPFLETLEQRIVPNGAPLAVNDLYLIPHGRVLIVPSATGVLANDTDPNNGTLAAMQVSGPSHGGLMLYTDGSFYYSPSSGYTGTDFFVYKAADDIESNLATVTILVTDLAPVASDIGPVAVLHGHSALIDLRANMSDADNDSLSLSIVQGPSHGYVYQDWYTGKFSYTAYSNYVGSDSFTFKANDGALDSNIATVSISVTDQAPVANDISNVSVLHGQSTNIDLAANVSDADGETPTVSIVQGPSHGYVYYNYYTGKYVYTSYSNYTGSDNFTFKANDGALDSNVAIVSISVTDQAPVANDVGPVAVFHGQSINIDLTANVTDADGETPTVSIVQQPSHGYVYFNYYTGKFNYTSYSNYVGSDSFTFKANDGALDSNIATVSINVTDQAPMANDIGTVAVLHGHTAMIDLRANTSDADNDGLSLSIVQGPSHGYVYQDWYTGKFNYTAYSNYVGSDSFTFKANDGALDSNIATVSISVTDQAPVANDISNVSVLHGQSTNIDLAANVSDADGETSTISIVQGPSHGYVYYNYYTGKYVYTAYSNYTGTDSFTFKANDGALDSNIAIVSINVTDQAPMANDIGPVAVLHGQSVNIDLADSFFDADGETLTISIVQNPTHGYVYYNYYTSKYVYTAYNSYVGPDAFTIKASDGVLGSNISTVTIDVTGAIVFDQTISVPHDQTFDLDLNDYVSNPYGATLQYIIVSNPSQGSLSANMNGTFTFTPTASWTGSTALGFKVNDGIEDSNVAIVTIKVINTVPTASDDHYHVDSGKNLVVGVDTSVLVNDTDLGDYLTAVIVTGPQFGTLCFNADGSFTYAVGTNFTGEDSFSYNAVDTVGATSMAIVNLTSGVVARDDVYDIGYNQNLTVITDMGVLSNDSGVDTNTTVLVIANPTHGSLTLNRDGSFTYVSHAGYSGEDQFTYQIKGSDSFNSATAKINVGGNAPAGLDDFYAVYSSQSTMTVSAEAGVLANDISGNALTAALDQLPTKGTLSLNTDGSFVYTAFVGEAGWDKFTYRPVFGATEGKPVAVNLFFVQAALPYTVSGKLQYGERIMGAIVNPCCAHGTKFGRFFVAVAANLLGFQ